MKKSSSLKPQGLKPVYLVQVYLIITLSLGSIGSDRVISETVL